MRKKHNNGPEGHSQKKLTFPVSINRSSPPFAMRFHDHNTSSMLPCARHSAGMTSPTADLCISTLNREGTAQCTNETADSAGTAGAHFISAHLFSHCDLVSQRRCRQLIRIQRIPLDLPMSASVMTFVCPLRDAHRTTKQQHHTARKARFTQSHCTTVMIVPRQQDTVPFF